MFTYCVKVWYRLNIWVRGLGVVTESSMVKTSKLTLIFNICLSWEWWMMLIWRDLTFVSYLNTTWYLQVCYKWPSNPLSVSLKKHRQACHHWCKRYNCAQNYPFSHFWQCLYVSVSAHFHIQCAKKTMQIKYFQVFNEKEVLGEQVQKRYWGGHLWYHPKIQIQMVFTTTGKGILLNNQTGDVFALSMVSLPLVAVVLVGSIFIQCCNNYNLFLPNGMVILTLEIDRTERKSLQPFWVALRMRWSVTIMNGPSMMVSVWLNQYSIISKIWSTWFIHFQTKNTTRATVCISMYCTTRCVTHSNYLTGQLSCALSSILVNMSYTVVIDSVFTLVNNQAFEFLKMPQPQR